MTRRSVEEEIALSREERDVGQDRVVGKALSHIADELIRIRYILQAMYERQQQP